MTTQPSEDIKIIPVDSTFPIERMVEFCKASLEDAMPAAQNMSPVRWEHNPQTLLYLIYREGRFEPHKRARYKVVEVNGEIVAGGGYYSYEADPNICLLSTRTYTIPSARNRMWHAEFLLPLSLKDIKELSYKVGLFVFNEYNLWLRDWIIRIGAGKGVVLGYQHADVYRGWSVLENPIRIRDTKQWGLYKMVDPSYEDTFLSKMTEIHWQDGFQSLQK